MVKRSRDQSHEAPRRFSWLMMVPPDSFFQTRPFEEGFARHVAPPGSLPLGHLALDHHLRGDAGMVGPGCHSTS
jgi:hypothetical protein